MVKMVTGLLTPSSGVISYQGRDIQEELLPHRRRIGYVPESPELYTYLTGPEYLTLIGRLRQIEEDVLDERIERFLRLWGIYDDRYASLSAYSKGMKQKILVSAALLHDPEIVVLDEPSSGLDVGSTLVLKQLIKELAIAGKVVLYSSHVLEMVEQVCSSVVILPDGQVRPGATPTRAHGAAIAQTSVHAARGEAERGTGREGSR
jgi:ABC-2 type transport system ATP-binding protein